MKNRKIAVTAAMALAATGVWSGIASAEPPASAAGGTALHYTAKIEGKSVVLSTDLGSLAVHDDRLDILDPAGSPVAGVPLVYRMDNLDHPIKAEVVDKTVVLTPDTTPAAAKPATDLPREGVVQVADGVQQIAASYPNPDARSADALGTLTQQLSVATLLSGMFGTIVGAGVGCVGGLVVGAAATAPVAWLLGAGPVASCLGGAVLFGALGAIGGTLLVGGPIAVAALFQYFQTINAPIVPPADPQPAH
ncbi:hypothetical protein NRB56_74530 [Nocardia sp. RB56]|uniref:DUF8020 domain-containing protein n=2 Tax=Nocardia aurantia TaxID=2585199 RepID=A0A7K0E355_9NOCA|nr:hypothetical protein [Nocardia aurantia]